MSKKATAHIRIEPDIKQEAENINDLFNHITQTQINTEVQNG